MAAWAGMDTLTIVWLGGYQCNVLRSFHTATKTGVNALTCTPSNLQLHAQQSAAATRCAIYTKRSHKARGTMMSVHASKQASKQIAIAEGPS